MGDGIRDAMTDQGHTSWDNQGKELEEQKMEGRRGFQSKGKEKSLLSVGAQGGSPPLIPRNAWRHVAGEVRGV